MKLNKLIFIFFLLSIALSGCSGGMLASSWPGLTVDTENGVVYIANGTQVHAINLSNGNPKWVFPEEPDQKKTFYAPPTLTENGQLIVAGYDHLLYSLDPQSGKANNWTFNQARGRFVDGPLATTNALFAPNADRSLYALDLSGKPLWPPFKSSQAFWAKPAIRGDILYLAGMDHKLYAIASDNGKVIWTQDLGGASVSTPTIAEDGTLYLGTFANELLAISSANGQILWRFSTLGWVWSAPAIKDDTLYFGDLSGTLYAVNRINGTAKWQIQPDGPITGKPLIMDETIYFGSEDGFLHAINLLGANLWSKDLQAKIYTAPASADKMILIALTGSETLLVAVDKDGNTQWSYTPAKK